MKHKFSDAEKLEYFKKRIEQLDAKMRQPGYQDWNSALHDDLDRLFKQNVLNKLDEILTLLKK